MDTFKPDIFIGLTQMLTKIPSSRPSEPVPDELMEGLIVLMEKLDIICLGLSLPASRATAKRTGDLLKRQVRSTAGEFRPLADDLISRLQDEMDQASFLF